MRRSLAAFSLVAALAAIPAAAGAAQHERPGHAHVRDAPAARGARDGASTTAIIGDIPYGAPLIAEFPQDVREINADQDVRRVVHLGDIKNGSSRCDTSYLRDRLSDLRSFADPLVYTPGDNEWTDCHRANNGGFLPTERLDTIRHLFFARPGHTLGAHPERVAFQSRRYPENVQWQEDGDVTFGVVHLVGSNDDHDVWFGDRKDAAGTPVPETADETAARSREVAGREAAAIEWIDAIFDRATEDHAPAVVLGMQADMWDPAAPAAELSAFDPIKAVIAQRSRRFDRPVLLLEGDSHVFGTDTPAGMPANLTRIVVQGSTSTPHEWVKLRVDPRTPGVFSCQNVEFLTKKATDCPGRLAPTP